MKKTIEIWEGGFRGEGQRKTLADFEKNLPDGTAAIFKSVRRSDVLQAQAATERFIHDQVMRKKASSIPSGEVLEHIRQLKISNVKLINLIKNLY